MPFSHDLLIFVFVSFPVHTQKRRVVSIFGIQRENVVIVFQECEGFFLQLAVNPDRFGTVQFFRYGRDVGGRLFCNSVTFLELENPQASFVDELFWNNILFHSSFYGRDDGIGFTRQQQDIGTGEQGANFHIPFETVLVANSLHLHSIGDNQPIIAQFFFKKLRNNGIGKR